MCLPFEFEKLEALLEVYKFILSDKSIMHTTADSARQYAINNFSLNVMATNTAKVYRRAMNS